jgi:hypothetical protein
VERDKPKKSESVGQTLRSCHGNNKGGIQKKIGFLSSNFMKLCRNIHRSVLQLFSGLNKFKMAAVAMVTQGIYWQI